MKEIILIFFFYAAVAFGQSSVKIVSDLQSYDAFNRLEVADPYTLGDYIHYYDTSPLLWDTLATGGASITHSFYTSSVTLSTSTNADSGQSAIFQSRRYHRYQAGKGGKVMMTAVIGASKAGVKKRWGYFDANNGLFFEYDSILSVNIRSSVSGAALTTETVSTSFNGYAASGAGTRPFTLDYTKAQIFEIDFQWLGVGIVDFYIYRESGSKLLLHRAKNANTLNNVYMTTARLPVRYEQTTYADNSDTSSLVAICTAVMSSGGDNPPQYEFSAGNTAIKSTAAANETLLVAFRIDSLYREKENRIMALPEGVEVSIDKGSALVSVYYGGTVTGGAWAYVDSAFSGMSYNTTATAFTTGRPILKIPYVASSGGPVAKQATVKSGTKFLAMTRSVDNTTSDLIIITIKRLTATNVDAMATMTWGEVH